MDFKVLGRKKNFVELPNLVARPEVDSTHDGGIAVAPNAVVDRGRGRGR